MPDHARTLLAWIADDPWRMACLEAVAGLALPDGWIGAGFLRNLVWDRLHGFETPLADVDVLFFDPRAGHEEEGCLEARLREAMPGVSWSARNQARMRARNRDAPYRDTADAIAHWLETPTAVAARLEAGGEPALLAPYGLDDLFGLKVRPTPHARSRPDRLREYRKRLAAKAWERTWPGVRVSDG
jgi:hypothetical protein